MSDNQVNLTEVTARELIKFLEEQIADYEKEYGSPSDINIGLDKNAGTAYDKYGGRCSPPKFEYYEPKLILRRCKNYGLAIDIVRDD